MSTKTEEIQFTIVPVASKPSITRSTNQKYQKIVEAAKKLKVTDSIRIPLTDSKGETNRNAIQTLKGHLTGEKGLTLKSNGKNYEMRISGITEPDKKVYAWIYYDEVKAENSAA